MTIDLKKEMIRISQREECYSEAELADMDAVTDLPTDNIARPRHQKKRRRGPVTKYAPTESRA